MSWTDLAVGVFALIGAASTLIVGAVLVWAILLSFFIDRDGPDDSDLAGA